MSPQPELPKALLETISWNPQEQSIWIASSLILRRNLARYKFPSKLQGPEVEQVVQILKSALEKIPELQSPHFYGEKEMSSADRELIFEHFLFLEESKQGANDTCFVLDDKGQFLALINTSNHLEMRLLNLSNQWENTWNTLAGFETQAGKNHDFAFSAKFGYLTSDPAQCGTGLSACAYIHLPALIHTGQLESAITNSDEGEVLFMGLSGNLEDTIGDLLVLQNKYSIGISEEAILHAIQTTATKLIGAEKTMREHLKKESNTKIKDLISKAFGMLCHCFQLETKEALDLLSLMKLGLALGYVKNVQEQKLNELFFKCRRGHLSHLFPEIKEPKELLQKRADFLQQELSGIALTPELE